MNLIVIYNLFVEENISYRSDKGHFKRPYSPTMDYNKEDQKTKSRKVENGFEYDRSFESDRSQDRYSRVGLDRRPSDQGLYMPSPPDYDRNRYGNYKNIYIIGFKLGLELVLRLNHMNYSE